MASSLRSVLTRRAQTCALVSFGEVVSRGSLLNRVSQKCNKFSSLSIHNRHTSNTREIFSSVLLENNNQGVFDAQVRGMAFLSLSNLRDNPGSRKAPKRLGRGVGSGLGKTSGRGMKGQKARSGNKGLRAGFEGGQTPFYKRIPKWGFTNNNFKQILTEINLDTLRLSIVKGKLNPTKPITIKTLYDANVIGKVKHGVKLLGRTSNVVKLPPLHIEVTRASKSAIEAVEKAGGTVVTTWYNRLGLRLLLKPSKFHPLLQPRRAKPPSKRMQYYTDPENRGYLSPEMQLKMLDFDITNKYEGVEEWPVGSEWAEENEVVGTAAYLKKMVTKMASPSEESVSEKDVNKDGITI